MREIAVGRSATYAAKISSGTITGINEINSLALGAIAVFADDNTMIDPSTAAADLADKKAIYIAVGSGDATIGAHVTKHIPRVGTRYDKKAYIAPVAQVKVLGSDGTLGALNLPTLIAGSDIYIKITDTSIGYLTSGLDIASYSDIVMVGDTAATIIARAVAAMNANVNKIVTAAAVAGNVGIKFTADVVGTTFDIAADSIFANSTVVEKEKLAYAASAVAVAPTYGNGTPAHLLAIENLFSTERGNTARIEFANRFWSVPTEVNSASTYDVYNMKWTNYKDSAAEGRQSVVGSEFVFALPVGATEQSDFEDIMAEAFGNAASAETGI